MTVSGTRTVTMITTSKGFYCPEGVLMQPYACPPGKYQGMGEQAVCLDCLEDYLCARNGTVEPVKCPLGRTNPPGSSFPTCGACKYEQFFYNATADACRERTVFCNLETHHELPTPQNRTREATCLPLTTCRTTRMKMSSPIDGNP